MSRTFAFLQYTKFLCASKLISFYEWFSVAHLMQYFFLEEEKDKSLSVITLQERLNSSWSDEEKKSFNECK